MTSSNQDILIVGTGMAGLGAAHRLQAEGARFSLVDQKSYAGGHTATHVADGFVFDEGPHVSFTADARIRDLLLANLGGEYEDVRAYIDNYWQGHRFRHPGITNLKGLPEQLVTETICDFVEAQNRPNESVVNYEQWLLASYGTTYARTFPMQYTRKYHTTEARNLSTEWVGPRLYQAKLAEILTGALAQSPPNIHYVQGYRYPKRGGFAEFLAPWCRQHPIELNKRLTAVEPKRNLAGFSDGSSKTYRRLISSVPLTELIPMIAGTPRDVVAAAAQLACTSVVLVNLGVAREDVSPSSWTYFYDDEYPFSRVSYPRNMSAHTCPPGTSSIQCEVYFSRKYRPLSSAPETLIQPCIDGLIRCGVLRDNDRLLHKAAMLIDYANIIFDLDRARALATVHGYLDDIGIGYCGRYGDWGYLWTDQAFLSGENAAQKAIESKAA